MKQWQVLTLQSSFSFLPCSFIDASCICFFCRAVAIFTASRAIVTNGIKFFFHFVFPFLSILFFGFQNFLNKFVNYVVDFVVISGNVSFRKNNVCYGFRCRFPVVYRVIVETMSIFCHPFFYLFFHVVRPFLFDA